MRTGVLVGRCKATGARTTSRQYVCEVVDRFMPVQQDENGDPAIWSHGLQRYIKLCTATCIDCNMFQLVERKAGNG
jgi:hypothetical protein